MSSFFGFASLQMPIFSATGFAGLWSEDCVLCLCAARAGMLCEACARDLSRKSAACPHCALSLPAAQGACAACRRQRFAFDRAIACFDYRFPLDRLVQRFKYAGDLALGRRLARSLAEIAAGEPRPDALVVPPLSPARLRARGFNQALEIAREVGRRLRVRVAPELLVRLRETPAQAGLGRRARRDNLRGAFACTQSLAGARVAIVDDVLTTGATADTIARVLKSAGAESVAVWALARAPDPSQP
jgi:ComF family protein